MLGVRMRVIRMCVGGVLLGTLAGCLSSTSYDSSLRDYERIPPPELKRADKPVDIGLTGTELELSPLVHAVLARNPNLEVARQAWRGVLASHDEVTAYGDTQLTMTVAPLSIISSDVRFGQTLQVSQALPYPGKRRLRGEIVLAEADAKREGYRAVRRRLAAMAGGLYYDYFLVGRALAINAEHIDIVVKYRDTVNLYMSTAKAWLEDAAEVRVAATLLKQERLGLESRRDVVIAQLNALLHRRPDASLPGPPTKLEPPKDTISKLTELSDEALGTRPELRAVRHRVRGAKSEIALANRDFYPDFRVIGSYNSMFATLEHQIMAGLSINLPLQRDRRRGTVARTRAKLRRTRADERRLLDDIMLEVETARRRAVAADDIAAEYRDNIIPAATARIAANRAGLATRRTNFVDVIREERNLKRLELRYAQAIAAAYRFRVELDRAVGRIVGMPREGEKR